MFLNCLAVGIGGFFGAILRYVLGVMAPESNFPYMTLFINISGTFLLAVITGLVLKNFAINEQLSLLIRVGFCGGYTTLSAHCIEVFHMVEQGSWVEAVVYVLLTNIACLTVAFAGIYLTR